jgi:acetyl esterase/lipase
MPLGPQLRAMLDQAAATAPPVPLAELPVDLFGWLAENASALGADPGALVVAGDSAGGNLAAAAALRARDGGGPAIAAQALAYPVTDATRQSAADPGGSYARWGEGYGLTAATMAWFIDCYLPDPASRGQGGARGGQRGRAAVTNRTGRGRGNTRR